MEARAGWRRWGAQSVGRLSSGGDGAGRGLRRGARGLVRGVSSCLLGTARRGRGQPASLPLALLLLHAPVLEPNLDLRLVELQGGGDLHPPGPAQVLVEMELLLQLGQLPRREVGAEAAGGAQAQLRHLC